jgi:threonine dehydrogenase-like Zn-dependent dehydrogenase
MNFALPTTMLAGRILAPHQLDVAEVPVPVPGVGEVLIEVARAGICGTDLHILDGDYALARFPMVPGHEFSGTIVAVGPGVRRRQVGERVTADPNLPCGLCPECQRGAVNQCHDLAVVGVTRDGAFARYVSVPEKVVVPIGDLSFAAAALVEPLACVAWGLERIRVRAGEAALIWGAGPMGCLLLQALRASGAARVAMVDVAPARLAVARELGAELAVTPAELSALAAFAPLGFELVVEATGVPAVLERAIGFVRPAGTIWVFGVAPGDALVSVSPYELFRRDLALVGSFAVNQTVPRAVAIMQGGSVRSEPLISHVLPIEHFAQGMEIARSDPKRMKIQFDLTGGRR